MTIGLLFMWHGRDMSFGYGRIGNTYAVDLGPFGLGVYVSKREARNA